MKRFPVVAGTGVILALCMAAAVAFAGDVPAEKQTKLGLYLTSKEAYDQWKAAPDAVKILDVRTPEEAMFVGRAEMAWNIPFSLQTYRWDPEKKHFAMTPNPDFLAGVKTWAKPTDTIYVMCRSGGRAARAVNALADAGYTQVYNIVDGMEGDLDENPSSPTFGKRTVNGWKNSGLPWTYQMNPEQMRLPAAK